MSTSFCVQPINKGALSVVSIRYPATYQNAFDLMAGELVVDFRGRATDPDSLYSATTSAGAIVRQLLDDGSVQIDISIPGASTNNFPLAVPCGFVVFDIARVIGGDRQIAPGQWRWPVRLPVTRP